MPLKQKTLVSDAGKALRQCPAATLRSLARQMTAHFDKRLSSVGLSYAQFNLLLHVAAVKNDTIGEVARQAGLDISTLSRNLHRLEAVGWVEITLHKNDLRRRAVWLTETGARRLEGALDIWKAILSDLNGQTELQMALEHIAVLVETIG